VVSHTEPEPIAPFEALAAMTAVPPQDYEEPDRLPSGGSPDQRDSAPAPVRYSLDLYIPPPVSGVRRAIGRAIRWFRPRPRTTAAEERKALKELRSLAEQGRASHKDRAVADQLGRLDSGALLSFLARPDTLYPLARLLLGELAERSPYWPAAEADEVCALVVRQRLYLAHLGRWRSAPPGAERGWGGPAMAEPDRESIQESIALAVSVFDWAVRPRLRRRLRRRKAAAQLERLIYDLLAVPGLGGKRVAVALALDERPLLLTQGAWRALLEQVLEPPLLPEWRA
jgi:hypothetical protein